MEGQRYHRMVDGRRWRRRQGYADDDDQLQAKGREVIGPLDSRKPTAKSSRAPRDSWRFWRLGGSFCHLVADFLFTPPPGRVNWSAFGSRSALARVWSEE